MEKYCNNPQCFKEKKLRINILNQLNIKEKKTIKFTYQTMKKNQAQKFVNKNSKIIKLYFLNKNILK
jgi:hypothetical protein